MSHAHADDISCDATCADAGDEHRDRPVPSDLAPSGVLRDEIARLRALVGCFPAGYLEAVADILRAGAERHGCAPHETGGGQGIDDHLQHLIDHALIADNDLSKPGATMPKPDLDSGRSQFAHVGARSALAFAMETAGRGEGRR